MRDLIVVAGGGGFIGGHLVADLLRQGHRRIRAVDIKPLSEWYQRFPQVENVRADLSGKEACERACRGATRVYNLACNMGGMGFIENNKCLCMLNVLINTHLLMGARRHGVRGYFFASSVCVYNTEKQKDPRVAAMREEDAYPALPEDGYGWEKLFSERMCRHFREDFGIATRMARFDNVYGPKGTWEGGRERAPAAICRKVIRAKVEGTGKIEIWGSGEQTRSFMYVADCVRGVQQLMHSEIADPINMGTGELVSINQLVDVAEEIAGVQLKREYNLGAPKGVAGRTSDTTRINTGLGWTPSVRLRDGMESTYASIFDEYMKKYGVGAARKAAVSAAKTRSVKASGNPPRVRGAAKAGAGQARVRTARKAKAAARA